MPFKSLQHFLKDRIGYWFDFSLWKKISSQEVATVEWELPSLSVKLQTCRWLSALSSGELGNGTQRSGVASTGGELLWKLLLHILLKTFCRFLYLQHKDRFSTPPLFIPSVLFIQKIFLNICHCQVQRTMLGTSFSGFFFFYFRLVFPFLIFSFLILTLPNKSFLLSTSIRQCPNWPRPKNFSSGA